MYYDTLDQIRSDMLSQEYRLRASMDHFEAKTKRLVGDLSNYSTVEFFHEEDYLKKEISNLRDSLDEFNTYLPSTKIVMQDRA